MSDFMAAATTWVRERPWLLKLMGRLHVWIYRLTGGRLGGAPFGIPTLLLMHRGRKSGREFVVPLYYVADGEDLAVAASKAGDPQDPDWWRNLKAAGGRGKVQVGPVVTEVVAAEAEGERREHLWRRLVEMYSPYEAYQRATARRIPVVLLRPVR